MARSRKQSEAAAENSEEIELQPVREPGDDPVEGRHTEKVRTPIPNPFAWRTNNEAGVEFRTAREPYQAEIKFRDGKPSDEVRTYLKSQQFRWSPDFEVWMRPIKFDTAAQDREIGRRIANDVIEMVLKEKGIEPAQEKSPAF